MAVLPPVPGPTIDPIAVFAGTVETINAHNEWHDTLHRKANYVHDVKDYGAVGDGVADDTAAFHAAGQSGLILIPPGDYLIDSLPISSSALSVRGAGSNLTRLIHNKPDGPILDFSGWAPQQSSNFRYHASYSGFSVVGQGTDITEVGVALTPDPVTGFGLMLIEDVCVRGTGGPAIHAKDLYCSTIRSCIFERPAGIDAGHDVPYALFDACNGTLVEACGFQSRTSSPDAPSGCVTLRGGHGVSLRDPWFEFVHVVPGGQVIFLDGGADNRVYGHRDYDSSPTAAEDTFYARLATSNGVDGNVWESEIPGSYGLTIPWTAGMQVSGARHTVQGRRGYNGVYGPNIILEPGTEYVSIVAAGQQSGGNPQIVDDRSGNTTNVLLDMTNGHALLTTLDGD